MRQWSTLVLALCLLCCTFSATAQSQPLQGTRTIRAHFRDGQTQAIGHIQFKPEANGAIGFAIVWDHSAFEDHFLSMREFKCLKGPGEIACLVPYPHRQPAQIRPGDWAWLEHNLMFMFKLPSEFGAKLWNGMYFRLREQGGQLLGEPMSIDLNEIAAPPPSADPPFSAMLRSDMDASARWLQKLSIE